MPGGANDGGSRCEARAALLVKLFERTGIALDLGDPAIAIVELNVLALEQHVESIVVKAAETIRRNNEELRRVSTEFAQSVALQAILAVSESQRTAQKEIAAASREAMARTGELAASFDAKRAVRDRFLIAWVASLTILCAVAASALWLTGRC